MKRALADAIASSPWTLVIKNLVFPIFCHTCGARLLTDENGYFCPTCWDLSPRIERPFCTLCGQPFAGRAGFGTSGNFRCERCRSEPEPPYDRIYGAAVYDGSVAAGIQLLKFHGKTRLAAALGELMAAFAEREISVEAYTHVVPVPLHKVRHRDRGFNQSELLAAYVQAEMPHAVLDTSLERIRPTRTQSRLADEKARMQNVAGAFAVPQQVSFEGASVLLIDDVVTSGGTVKECARALKRAGARRVDVFAAALPIRETSRTPTPLTIASG